MENEVEANDINPFFTVDRVSRQERYPTRNRRAAAIIVKQAIATPLSILRVLSVWRAAAPSPSNHTMSVFCRELVEV